MDASGPTLESVVTQLIEEGEVDLVRGDGHPNPHIKAFPAEPIDVQLEKIRKSGLGAGCLYLTPVHLARRTSGTIAQAPYTRALQQGEPHLSFRVFDLRVLEWYRNDPRFSFEVDDIHGRVQKQTESADSAGAVLRDQLDFFEFGFAYDDDFNRAIAVFLRYLHDLPADQQQYLSHHELGGSYKLHPDFYRTQIIGDFPERVSIYDAFLEEKWHINEMCKRIGKPPLFKSTNRAYRRPSSFGILLRPTKKEFREFALLLDQLLSDDINREFFTGEFDANEVSSREDGTTVTQPIGTIKLLEQYVRKHFRPKDEPEALEKIFRNIRTVRKERQKPAHVADENAFDQAYIKQQRELIEKAFDAARTIRMVIENHPRLRDYKLPDWLRKGCVWLM